MLSGISLDVKKRDKLMIIGPNGCGKSTLIRILGGIDEDFSGEVRRGYNVITGYYDQEQQTLDDEATVLEEVCRAHDRLTIPVVRSALASFLFFSEDMEKKVAVLSGGERARLMLCKMILSKINLLVLDEPTNHLDIASREALEDALADFSGTIIAVSHDRYFIKKLSTRIFDMSHEPPRDYRGGYDEYVERVLSVENQSPAEAEKKQDSDGKQRYLESKKLSSDIRRSESRIKRAEGQIMSLEEERSALEKESEGEASSDYTRLSEIYTRISEIDATLDSLYDDIADAEKTLEELGGKND